MLEATECLLFFPCHTVHSRCEGDKSQGKHGACANDSFRSARLLWPQDLKQTNKQNNKKET